MKRALVLTLFLCAFTGGLYAQAVDTTVCAVLKNPTAFNGKIVRIKGTVVAGFDQFVIDDSNCGLNVNSIWLSYPQGTKGKAGPLALVQLEPAHNFFGTIAPVTRTPVTLVKDKEFKHLDSLLAEFHTSGQGTCLGCRRYNVEATLVGRLDGVGDATLQRNAAGKIVGLGGFGNMNAYPARLVLESVSDVTPKEIDYSKSDAMTKNGEAPTQAPAPGGNQYIFNPLDSAKTLVAKLEPGQLTTQIQKDVAAFGEPKEPNGVSIGYGTINEVSETEGGLGERDSPDGVLYNCTLNRDRLGDSVILALVHLGQHVNDLRDPPPGNEDAPPVILENNAWVVTTVLAVTQGAKFFRLPGGYLMWNSSWPDSERNGDMEAALNSFLSNQTLLSK